MGALLSLLLVTQAFTWREVPAGTALHVRLTDAVGTYASRPGSPVSAVLIAPVAITGGGVLPAGSILSGEVSSVQRIGLGVVRERASLTLDFHSLALPGMAPGSIAEPVFTRMAAVDTGREEVTPTGSIRETRATSSLGNRALHYARKVMMFNLHAQLALFAIKSVLMQVPEPEIYLPTGAELTLTLTQPLRAPALLDAPDGLPRGLTAEERDDLAPAIAKFPERTSSTHDAPSDLVNLVLIGSHDEIAAAFDAAGWSQARPYSFRANWKSAMAIAFNSSYQDAPMSSLLVNDLPADMSWQKGFNDIYKRHHVRLWSMGETEDGREIWIGAATRDIDVAYFRPGAFVTHKVAGLVDQERDKIVNDLVFTSCTEAVDWWDRPGMPHESRNATGDRLSTDTRLAVVAFNACQNLEALPAGDTLPMHGSKMQRVVRREIMSFRSDMIRNNPYWRAFEGARTLVTIVRQRRQVADPDAPPRATLASRLQSDRLTSFVSFH
jgi:LssY C-terminus